METKYLIKVKDKIYGYNSIALMKIDILMNLPENYEVYINQSLLSLKYVKLSKEEADALLKGGK